MKQQEAMLEMQNLQYLSGQVFKAAQLDLAEGKARTPNDPTCIDNLRNLLRNYVESLGTDDVYTKGVAYDDLLNELVEKGTYKELKKTLEDGERHRESFAYCCEQVLHTSMEVAGTVLVTLSAGVVGLSAIRERAGELSPIDQRGVFAVSMLGVAGAALLSGGGKELAADAELNAKLDRIKDKVQHVISSDFNGKAADFQGNIVKSNVSKLLKRRDYEAEGVSPKPKGRG